MSVVTVIVTSDGTVMDPGYELLSLDVVREVNRIPSAQLTFNDGDAAKRLFPISSGKFFAPGKPMEIKLRYEGVPASEKTVFTGQVVGQSIESRGGGSVLNVELKHASVKMSQGRNYRLFNDQTDADIIKSLLTANGQKPGTIAATTPVHKEIVQFGCSDWDFLLARAELNGLLVNADDTGVIVKKPELEGSPQHSFRYGLDEILAFDFEARALGQMQGVSALAWDISQQAMNQSDGKTSASPLPGNLSPNQLAKSVSAGPYVLANSAPVASEEAVAWATGRLVRNRLAMIRGHISVAGTGDIKPLQTIRLDGLGDRFNGNTLVTGVRHRVTVRGWITDLQIGLADHPTAPRSDVPAPTAAELIPPLAGLHIGVVAGYEEDPDKQFRVKVQIPALGKEKNLLWARLASPDAGEKRGYFFRPEPGDEVVLGFFNDDPRHPVILGSLFSTVNSPPDRFAKLSQKNPAKGLVTRGGTVIAFDDGKHSLTIETPKANRVLLDDDGKKIAISDQHGNQITLDGNGITIKSGKNLKISAAGNVEISGKQVDIK